MRGQGAIIKRRSTRQTCSLKLENRSCLVEQVNMLLKEPTMYIDVRKCRRYLRNLSDGTESDSDTIGGIAIQSSNCFQYDTALLEFLRQPQDRGIDFCTAKFL